MTARPVTLDEINGACVTELTLRLATMPGRTRDRVLLEGLSLAHPVRGPLRVHTRVCKINDKYMAELVVVAE